jgi:hypothetical protein
MISNGRKKSRPTSADLDRFREHLLKYPLSHRERNLLLEWFELKKSGLDQTRKREIESSKLWKQAFQQIQGKRSPGKSATVNISRP